MIDRQQQLADANAANLLLNGPGWRLLVRLAEELDKRYADGAFNATEKDEIYMRTLRAQGARQFWTALHQAVLDYSESFKAEGD